VLALPTGIMGMVGRLLGWRSKAAVT